MTAWGDTGTYNTSQFGRKDSGMNTNIQADQFNSIDIGLQPEITVPLRKVRIQISSQHTVAEYARSFVKIARRKRPLQAEQVGLTEEEMVNYAQFLLAERIKIIDNDCPNYRKLKTLWIPSFLQLALSLVGTVVDRSFALKIIPTFEEKVALAKFEDALDISDKVGMFEDCMSMHLDAMPRSIEGNEDVMSCACIADHIRSYKSVGHPIAVYVAAFLSNTLEDKIYEILYPKLRDPIDYISVALVKHGGIYGIERD